MKKNLFSKKQKENKPESEQTVPPSETKKPNVFVKLFGWVIFLTVLGLGCFLLYPELASSQAPLTKIDKVSSQGISQQKKTIQPIEITKENTQQQPPSVMPVESVQIPSPVINQQKIIEEPKQQPEKIEAAETPLPSVISRPKFIKQPTSQYTILQALAFKNAVLMHKNCREYVETLLHLENPTEAMKKVIKTFLPYCLHQDTERDDINVFLAHKKQAVLSLFQQKHSTIVAYFYALPWLIMDIHKIQPETDEPMDVLDRLHTAILENNTENALAELEKLPPRIGAIFNDIRQQLQEQQQRLAVLDELIISLADKGE